MDFLLSVQLHFTIDHHTETLDLVSLNKAAKLVDDEHRDNLIVSPGEWG